VKPIVLATQSRYKIAQFKRLGLPFTPMAPPFEERVEPGLAPGVLAERMALGKAQSLAGECPRSVIIGADQVLALGDRIFVKPGTVDKAVEQLLALAGKTHELHTAFALLDAESGDSRTGVVVARIAFHDNLSPEYLRRMATRERSWDCVGGYKYESQGPLLMERVETEDADSIVGLPLLALAAALDRWGYLRERFNP